MEKEKQNHMTKSALPKELVTHIEELIDDVNLSKEKFSIDVLLPIEFWPTYYSLCVEGTTDMSQVRTIYPLDRFEEPYDVGPFKIVADSINIGGQSGDDELINLVPDEWTTQENF